MIPTRRAQFLLAGLLVVSIAAVWWAPLRLIGLGLDVLALAVFAVDFWWIPKLADWTIERRVPQSVGLSNEFERTLTIGAPSPRARGLRLAVYERFAPDLVVRARTTSAGNVAAAQGDPSGGPDEGLAVHPTATTSLRRVYRAERRGLTWLGDVRLRVTGPLGLVQRQRRLYAKALVQVEPPLLGLAHTLRLAASDRWRDLGVRRVRRRGGLTEFESLREYVHGDDMRLVDWKAFARRGRPAVRQFQEERGQELLILVDCGRRMAAATAEGAQRGWTKLDHALDTALQLAAVALQKSDRVGILSFDDELRAFVAPARGARQLARLREAVFDLLPSSRESDLERALREVAVRHPRRAMLLILSDVADPLSVEAQRRALSAGRKHHRVLFASLDDPGVRRAALGESSARSTVRAAALALAEERQVSLRELARSGARVLDALPAEAAAPLLAAWLDARRSGLN